MSVTFGFYNSVDGDRKYDARDVSNMFEGILKDGVFADIGTAFEVTESTGMTVLVGLGRAWFNKTWTNNDSLLPLTLSASELVLNRIDAIVLEIDASDAVRTNSIKVVKGTPGVSPVNPIMLSMSTLHQYPLAYIYVGTGVTSIITANITKTVGTAACPYSQEILHATGLVDQSGTGTSLELGLIPDGTYLKRSGATIEGVAQRELLTADRTYYLRTDGDDSHTGLANTAGGAWLTIQHAIDVIAGTIDTSGYNVTIQLADGTYTISGPIYGKNIIGGGTVTIKGNTGTPANTIISFSGPNATFNHTAIPTKYFYDSLKFVGDGTTARCFWIQLSYIGVNNLIFSSGFTLQHFMVVEMGEIEVVGNYTIEGSINYHWANYGGTIRCQSRTITLTGTPSFYVTFAMASRSGIILCNGNTFVGSGIGKRYTALSNGVVDAVGSSETYLPGTIAGTKDTGGQYLGTAVGYRPMLTAARTYYVGYNLGVCAISIASPAVVTLTSHGLAVNSQVVFQVPSNTKTCTISAANPAVVTMANNFAAGQPVIFQSTSLLPGGLQPNTVYYVIAAGLSSTQFEISATVGGAAINTTAQTATFTNGSATITTNANHNLVVGQIIRFAGITVANFANATDYYVTSVPTGTTFQCAATNGGTPISAGPVTSNGTMAQNGTHYCSTKGALPTGITEGTAYYVGTVPNANTFTLSTTLNNANPVNTSGTVTGSPVYTVYTGSDSNEGLVNSAAGALLTIQKAIDICYGIDLATYMATIQVADGTYTAGATLTAPFDAATGTVYLQGNLTLPSNCLINTGGSGIVMTAGSKLALGGFKIIATGSGFNINEHCELTVSGAMEFGACGGNQLLLSRGSLTAINAAYVISGGGATHINLINNGVLICTGKTIPILGVFAFTIFISVSRCSTTNINGNTYAGSTTGTRASVDTNGVINTSGAAATYFPGNVANAVASGGQIV